MSDVFISYANADRERAAALAEALGLRGYSVWWDRTIPPGRVFDEVIQEALGSAGCVVVLWSRASAASNWVKTEAAEGASRKVLVPAVIDDVSIPIEFRRIQTANLQDWTGDPDHPELESLVQSVERLKRGASPALPASDHRPSGGLTPSAPRITPRAAAAVALFAAAGAGLLLTASAWWPAGEAPVGTPGSGAAAAQQPGDSSADVPTASTGNAARAAAPATVDTNGGPAGGRVNLFAKENGGMIVAASSDDWARTIDGREDVLGIAGEAVFAFRDERPGLFDTFTVLVSAAGDIYLRDVELLAGNESPTGRFQSLGTFHTQNMKLFKTPYQEFPFAAARARYVKIRALANHGGNANVMYAQEFQLWGVLDPQ